MSFKKLEPLLKKSGSSLSVESFQERINIVFHDIEAAHYDAMHADMWGSLQEQINLLVSDIVKSDKLIPNNMRLLDIGAGTGLSSQILLNSEIGEFITEVTLLDTSSKMLEIAESKAKTWGKDIKIVNGSVSDLKEKFDVIIICSVLHHIPDLDVFLSQMDDVLKSGGILIHLQDPNGDFLKDSLYLGRVASLKESQLKSPKKRSFQLIPKSWKKYINRKIGRESYIDEINYILLNEKTIRKRLTADEIWSVTDIHVESDLNKDRTGILFTYLKSQLSGYILINRRSYGFFGLLKSDLSGAFLEEETKYIENNELNGRNLSCLWIKK